MKHVFPLIMDNLNCKNDYSSEYDERYPENNLDTILTDDALNDSLIEEIKSIPGVTDVMTREIVSVNLNGTRFPAAVVSKKDFDFMRPRRGYWLYGFMIEAVRMVIFSLAGQRGWNKMDMLGQSIAFDFENGSVELYLSGKDCRIFCKCGHILSFPEGVYRSMNLRGTAWLSVGGL